MWSYSNTFLRQFIWLFRPVWPHEVIKSFMLKGVSFCTEPTHPTNLVSTQLSHLQDWHCCLPIPIYTHGELLLFTKERQHPFLFYWNAHTGCCLNRTLWNPFSSSRLCLFHQCLPFSWALRRILLRWLGDLHHLCSKWRKQISLLGCWNACI